MFLNSVTQKCADAHKIGMDIEIEIQVRGSRQARSCSSLCDVFSASVSWAGSASGFGWSVLQTENSLADCPFLFPSQSIWHSSKYTVWTPEVQFVHTALYPSAYGWQRSQVYWWSSSMVAQNPERMSKPIQKNLIFQCAYLFCKICSIPVKMRGFLIPSTHV